MGRLLAPDVEELVVAYLSTQLSNVAVQMGPSPTMPFYLVNRISGGDDDVTDRPAVSIHAFNTTRTAANTSARTMHALMKRLTAQVPVLMSDSTYASVDYVYVLESPHWEDYGDKAIQRYCGRYRIDLRCNLTT